MATKINYLEIFLWFSKLRTIFLATPSEPIFNIYMIYVIYIYIYVIYIYILIYYKSIHIIHITYMYTCNGLKWYLICDCYKMYIHQRNTSVIPQDLIDDHKTYTLRKK